MLCKRPTEKCILEEIYIEVFVIRNYCVVRNVDRVLSVESAHPQVGVIY